MKYTRSLILAVAALSLTSCADDNWNDFRSGNPRDSRYDYLNDYNDLKTYVDRAKSPAFKLGGATSADEFNKKALVYTLDVANFDELVTGNDFKLASCVDEKGSFNFTKVQEFSKNAVDAGLSVFGHTLVWHSQQQPKFLNSIIADKEVKVDPNAKTEVVDFDKDWTQGGAYSYWCADAVKPNVTINSDGFNLVNEKAVDNWAYQYHIGDGLGLKKGQNYQLQITMKASGEGTMDLGVGGWSERANGQINFNSNWKTYKIDFTAVADGGFVLAQTGKYVGTIQIKEVKVVHLEAPVMKIYVNQITNSKMEEGKSMDNFVVREPGKSDVSGKILVGQGPEGQNCTVIRSHKGKVNDWDTQFFIYTPNKVWEAGEDYKISFWYKASAKADCSMQCHAAPGGYIHYQFAPSNPSFTTEWKHFEYEGVIPDQCSGKGMKSIAFNLNVADAEIDYYFADIEFSSIKKGNTIPLTDEEKADTLTKTMETWIKGMMTACEGRVKAWDVVNEPMSDSHPSELKSAAVDGGEKADENFYWQDYMGKDYARKAVEFARKYAGTDLTLFVNDYGLESSEAKTKGLIDMINYWESDKVTKIDGIGTQMHVTYYLDEAAQKQNEEGVVRMFKQLAATGKLVRVSELDMGIATKPAYDGSTTIKTDAVTFEQLQKMAEYYKFIVKAYLENVPAAQQYGIVAWGITDADPKGFWRAGEPIGLWDKDYYRKPAYGGFADGLQGK